MSIQIQQQDQLQQYLTTLSNGQINKIIKSIGHSGNAKALRIQLLTSSDVNMQKAMEHINTNQIKPLEKRVKGEKRVKRTDNEQIRKEKRERRERKEKKFNKHASSQVRDTETTMGDVEDLDQIKSINEKIENQLPLDSKMEMLNITNNNQNSSN